MTEEQAQTGGDWEKLPQPVEHPGPQRNDRENSGDAAVGRGSNHSPDLLQMLRAAESRRGAYHSRDQDMTEAGEPVTEAQRTDMVSWDVNVLR